MVSQKRGRPPGRPKLTENDKPTSEKIMLVATKLFIESGFQKVSIDDIAKEAGMTKATVYYYYGSKAELFKNALVELMGRIRKRIDALLKSDQPLYDRLLEVTRAHLQATTTIDLDGFMRESKNALSEEQVEAMKLAEEQMFAAIEQGFKEAEQSGELPELDAQFAAHAYLALLRVGNYRNMDGASLFATIEEASERILSLLWNGLFGGYKK